MSAFLGQMGRRRFGGIALMTQPSIAFPALLAKAF
jgi:hypothetical protein